MVRRIAGASLLSALLLRLVACASFSGSSEVAADGGATLDAEARDGNAVDADAADGEAVDAGGDTGAVVAACNADAGFTGFAALPGIPALQQAAAPRASLDELTLYFYAVNGAGNTDIFVATRATRSAPWGSVQVVAALAVPMTTDAFPAISGDGLIMVFESGRGGKSQVWLATRATALAGWTVSGAPLTQSSAGAEGQTYFDPKQSRAYFISNGRDGGATGGGFDIYAGDLANGTLSNVVAVPGLNSSANESTPVVTHDALTIYFASGRSGTQHLLVAHRTSTAADFGAPEIATDLDGVLTPGWFSTDGCRVYGWAAVAGGTELRMGARPH